MQHQAAARQVEKSTRILVLEDNESARFVFRAVLEPAGYESVYHLFVIRTEKRDAIRQALLEKNIGCGIHYPLPLHLQKCYADLGHKPGSFPIAEKAARECLSLPIYPEMTDTQIERVAEVIKDFFARG